MRTLVALGALVVHLLRGCPACRTTTERLGTLARPTCGS